MIDFRLNNTTANSTGKKTGAIRKLQVKTEKKKILGELSSFILMKKSNFRLFSHADSKVIEVPENVIKYSLDIFVQYECICF